MRHLALLLLAALGTAFANEDRDTFAVDAVSARAGSVVSGVLTVAAGSDEGVDIPITIAHGAEPGPVLALFAGTHGYEYPPITALQHLRSDIDAEELRGTVVMVHLANPASFFGRSIYTNPVDGKNLNRMYPGDPRGTQSQRIAYRLTTEIIDNADYVIDLHAGDGNEALRPFVYMPKTGIPELDAGTRRLALAFGLDHIVIDESPLRDREDSLYLDHTALTRGVPGITTETGQLGSNAENWVALAEAGIWNVLRELAMVPGQPIANDAVVWLTDYEVILSPARGVFRAAVRDGYTVAEGGTLGTLVDAFGDTIEVIRAPFAGVVNYVVATPPVDAGEPVAMISKVAANGGREGQAEM